ncbi:MAG TPA: hypothetical protein PLL10_11570, partial [Elusimicrobiales bacterium]|nr:hypothetical protein [Elusimicrobiales bacterium]
MDQRYTFNPPKTLTVWLETAGLTAAFVAAGYVFHREDPFFMVTAFPWAMFLPLAAGMRYGTLSASGATISYVAAFYLSLFMGWAEDKPDSVPVFVGMGIASIVAGEFRDLWVRKILSAQAINSMMETRLEEFARAYNVLRISHDAMETRLAAGQRSLRQMLLDARRTLGTKCLENVAFGGYAPRLASLFLNATDIQALVVLEVRDGGVVLLTMSLFTVDETQTAI